MPEAGRFGPFGALPLSITDVPPAAVGMGDLDVVAGGVAVLLMLAWIAAVFAAGAALLPRRDVSG